MSRHTVIAVILLLCFPGTYLSGQTGGVNRGKYLIPIKKTDRPLITDGVLDGPSSIVVEQAANREITAQAVLKMILERK